MHRACMRTVPCVGRLQHDTAWFIHYCGKQDASGNEAFTVFIHVRYTSYTCKTTGTTTLITCDDKL